MAGIFLRPFSRAVFTLCAIEMREVLEPFDIEFWKLSTFAQDQEVGKRQSKGILLIKL